MTQLCYTLESLRAFAIVSFRTFERRKVIEFATKNTSSLTAFIAYPENRACIDRDRTASDTIDLYICLFSSRYTSF